MKINDLRKMTLMETEKKDERAGARDITPEDMNRGIPPLGELLDALFAGFAPAPSHTEGDRP